MKRNAIIAMSAVALIIVAFIIIKRRKKMKYFSIKELCQSEVAEKYGIDNTPSEEAKSNMENLIVVVLDPCREKYGSPIYVNSGYRSRRLNAEVGGEDTSDHLTGEAADITGGSVEENRKIFRILVENGKFDQLIWEKGGQWIHVSWRGDASRHIMLEFKNGSYRRIDSNWEEVINN
jgi:hypothetical protein